jgi:hypothetical protein
VAGLSATNPHARNSSPLYPLKLSDNGRYLVDQQNTPFLVIGDSAWFMITHLSLADIDSYTADRAQRGFNAIAVELLDESGYNLRDADGDVPFTGRAFVTPNPSYFKNMDYILLAASARGMTVFLAPTWLRGCPSTLHYCAEVQDASIDEMYTWGQFVGDRYRNSENIVWIMGGDTDSTVVADKIQSMVDGMRDAGAHQLYTYHGARGRTAIDNWDPAPPWLILNNIYTSTPEYPLAQTAYNVTPSTPFFLIEGYYEGGRLRTNSYTSQQLRAQSYWTFLSGSTGAFFGNCPLFAFNSMQFSSECNTVSWQSQLSSQGTMDMARLGSLFKGRAWYDLVPDFDHTVVTSGLGTYGQNDYVTAAASSSMIVAYLPSARTITISTLAVSGLSAAVSWYNPSNGNIVFAGNFTKAADSHFAPPSSGDWVFVAEGSTNPVDSTPPTVAITRPGNGATVARRSTITINASASDDVSINRVEFYVSGTLQCTANAAPYSCSWSVPAQPNVTYDLLAKAYDGPGNTSTATVSVTAK